MKNLFHYRAYECSYRTLSSRVSGVLITHQPHQRLMFTPSSTTISLHHHLRPHPLRLQPRPLIGNEPLPSIEGCGLNQRHLRSEDSTAAPLPFQRDVGWLIFTQWGELGRSAKEWGKEKNEGGPRNWEVHPVRHKTNHDGKSWFIFSYLSFHSPQ